VQFRGPGGISPSYPGNAWRGASPHSQASRGAFRVLCRAFRHGDLPEFFATAHPGPRAGSRFIVVSSMSASRRARSDAATILLLRVEYRTGTVSWSARRFTSVADEKTFCVYSLRTKRSFTSTRRWKALKVSGTEIFWKTKEFGLAFCKMTFPSSSPLTPATESGL
jgi:hypothetical protein